MKIDFDEVQKAMEDTVRDAFDYFLDRETGEVIILSEDIIRKSQAILDESYDDDIGDYEDVVVHIFLEPVRQFYDLEGLWMDAPRINVQKG